MDIDSAVTIEKEIPRQEIKKNNSGPICPVCKFEKPSLDGKAKTKDKHVKNGTPRGHWVLGKEFDITIKEKGQLVTIPAGTPICTACASRAKEALK